MLLKKVSVLVSVFTMSLFLASALPAEAASKSVRLRLGHEMPESHPYHAGAKKFADLAAEKSGGAITIQIFPNGSLGSQGQLAEGLTMGTVDLALTNTMVLEKYEPLVSVLGLPYLMRNWEHVYKAVDGPIGDELNVLLGKKGINVLAYCSVGTIYINSTKLVKGPEDMKGMKLRVQPGPSYVEAAKTMEAVVTTTSFSEVYTALQLGTIDAQTQSISNVLSNKHYEVAKFIALNDFGYLLEPLSISVMVYDRLDAEQKKILKEAAYEAAVWQRQYMADEEKKGIETLKGFGVTVTQSNLDEWRAVLEPLQQKFPKWLDLINKIKAVQ